MSIHDHPKLALSALFVSFLFAFGLAVAATSLFNVSAPTLSAPSCTNSSAGLNCVGFVQTSSNSGTLSYEMLVANGNTGGHCPPSQVVYIVVTNVTSGQSYVIYANHSCLFSQ